MEEKLPQALYSSTLTISGVTLHVHVLDNGQRVIDAADLEALFAAWGDGAAMSNEEAEALARWSKGLE